ncbi:MAG: NAD(P)-binding domain-containing protein, partial [Alphaproteobacteria bacterium]|nr:NAD(P)-binding domain-containing protein [Alphaproteobacteria bacterium]
MAREIIGLVGPGRMGYAMLKHLIVKGYGVTVTDINADNIARAIEAGAEGADSPAALGAVSDFVIIAVGFDHEALAVTLGDFGLLQSMGPGSVIAVSSTVAPETVQRIE